MPTPGAHAVIALIEPGVVVYSRERGYEGVFDDGTQVEPVGGVVLDVWEEPNEDGERERFYRVLDPWRLPADRPGRFAYHVLLESEIDRDRLSMAEPSVLSGLYFRLAEHLGTKGPGKRRRGLVMPELLEYHEDLNRLRRLLVL